jgi:hypothetical protein
MFYISILEFTLTLPLASVRAGSLLTGEGSLTLVAVALARKAIRIYAQDGRDLELDNLRHAKER